ncbi:MAG: nucleotidyltransferase domain-containing protein [Armatimonadota bacterium]|nr:nucleotidyltransferase domain-containing protein [Armatimonadota bacterium]MDR7451994.1 nucleotidyltransferase domain-containing protein [Armatimonadota bacterium]MDR7467885.1 nucleotidyltransferase domain-containing protein [Armatimonadota bacterium]MDR7494262.1 nucleotidyltransferase domain-containing protein [Armatimonadota bacterium]MDR7500043.1 nucleotidyltransferase domain-containing protein [Armatimonadota bacterium]
MISEDHSNARAPLPRAAETDRALAEVARRHDVRLVIAFGSRAKGKVHPGSDLDLAVLVDRPADHREEDLGADLQALFPDRIVDVVWLHRADPLLAWEITRAGRLLYGERSEWTRYAIYAWRRFVDYMRFFDLEADAVERGVARLRHAR